eukprot:snap_masked-scaffold_4-processed-gene-10.14-mRNA-1 protein AED:1.00 eAED:1.00 QI:0/0/0/0/1/1/2/0/194
MTDSFAKPIDSGVEPKPSAKVSKKGVEEKKDRLLVGELELLFICTNRLYYSRFYSFLYLSILLLNFSLLFLVILDTEYAHTYPFLTCEVLILVLLTFELVIKFSKTSKKKEFFASARNIFDTFVVLFCVINSTEETEVDEVAFTAVVGMRYAASLLQLISLLKERERLEEIIAPDKHEDEIDFSTVEETNMQIT